MNYLEKNQVGICCTTSTGAWAMSDRGEGKIKRTAEEHHFDITL